MNDEGMSYIHVSWAGEAWGVLFCTVGVLAGHNSKQSTL